MRISPPEPTDAEVATAIAETVGLDRARGARFTRTESGGLRRYRSLDVLFEREALTARAMTGAEAYRNDYLASIEAASMRCTIFARVGARDDEEVVLARAQSASATLCRLHAAITRNPEVVRMVQRLCGREESSEHIERSAVRLAANRHLEAIADWYDANETRGSREHDEVAMRMVDAESWWVLARVFNPRMSREAFEVAFLESGMAEEHELVSRRAGAGRQIENRVLAMVNDQDIERRAAQMFEAHARKFQLRVARWADAPGYDRQAWRERAEADYRRVA